MNIGQMYLRLHSLHVFEEKFTYDRQSKKEVSTDKETKMRTIDATRKVGLTKFTHSAVMCGLLAISFLISGSSSAQTTVGAMETNEGIMSISPDGALSAASAAAKSALENVQARWNDAAKNWDVAALTALYTKDALMYGGRPDMSVGLPGVNRYFSSYSEMLTSANLDLKDQVVVELASDMYLAQGFGVFGIRLKSGKDVGTTMRTTLLIVNRDGEWKILDHHFSSSPEAPPIPQ